MLAIFLRSRRYELVAVNVYGLHSGLLTDLKGESGGTGRRTGLRIQLWKQNGSSNLPSRTSFIQIPPVHISTIHICHVPAVWF